MEIDIGDSQGFDPQDARLKSASSAFGVGGPGSSLDEGKFAWGHMWDEIVGLLMDQVNTDNCLRALSYQ